jgi:ribosomal protein L40E
MVKQCEKCGAKNSNDAQFCESCGASLLALEKPAEKKVEKQAAPSKTPEIKSSRIVGIVVTLALVIVISLVAVWFLFLRGPSPENTIKASADAINARDVDKIYSFYSSQVKSQYSKTEVEDYLNTFGWPTFSDLEILGANTTDSQATVHWRAKVTMGGETTTLEYSTPLVKENGEWKINQL